LRQTVTMLLPPVRTLRAAGASNTSRNSFAGVAFSADSHYIRRNAAKTRARSGPENHKRKKIENIGNSEIIPV
jgi:hypothetical protein